MKRNIRLVAIGVALFVFLCIGTLGPVLSQMPRPQSARIDATTAVGVNGGSAFAWIVPSDSGVVLVDTGMDGAAVLAELETRGLTANDVVAVLLTHGHIDHTGGLAKLGEVSVHVGPGEAALVRGERYSEGALPGLLESFVARPAVRGDLREVADGATLEIDGLSFTAIHTPGHTPGSTMYLLGDLLFTGDSLAPVGDDLTLLPASFADDIDANRRSLDKLRDVPFTRVADGHGGLTLDAKSALLRTLGDSP